MEDRAARYLDAFSRIEKRLRVITGQRKGDTFFSLARTAASKDRTVARWFDDLRELADLRNAIVHDRRGGAPIAEPNDYALDLIEQIARQIEDPPRVSALPRRAVVCCAPGERIATAATRLLDGGFSQLPVYAGEIWRGLLTAETIARWLAHRFRESDGPLEDESVEAVLAFRERSGSELFVREDSPLLEVIEAFHRAAERGTTLDAVLVTAAGGRDEPPLSILTVFDLPELYRHVAVHRGVRPPPRAAALPGSGRGGASGEGSAKRRKGRKRRR